MYKTKQFEWVIPTSDNVGGRCRAQPLERNYCPRVKFPSPVVSGLLLVIIFGALWLPTSAAATKDWQPLEDIRSAAVGFVKSQATRPGQDTTVTAGELDGRLRLHLCDKPLTAFLPPGARIAANTTVGVSCPSPRKWKLFVPVRVGVAAHVLVAAKPLQAGTVLTDNDFIAEKRDLGRLRGGYLREGESVSGMVLRRRLSEGEPLRNELLNAPDVVRRGQSVTIYSGSKGGPVAIRMAGTALSNGRLGQRIRVKNRSSGRTVEGIVQSSEVVKIGN